MKTLHMFAFKESDDGRIYYIVYWKVLYTK